MTDIDILEPGTVIRARVRRWSSAISWPADTSSVRLHLTANGYWVAVGDDPAYPFTIPPVPKCREAITVLDIEREPTIKVRKVRSLLARLEELRAKQISAPEQRVADEAVALVKGFLEDR